MRNAESRFSTDIPRNSNVVYTKVFSDCTQAVLPTVYRKFYGLYSKPFTDCTVHGTERIMSQLKICAELFCYPLCNVLCFA